MSTFLTIKDAARILGVTTLTLRNWDKAGKLKANRHPFNNYRIYKVEEIESILDAMGTAPQLLAKMKAEIKKIKIQHIDD